MPLEHVDDRPACEKRRMRERLLGWKVLVTVGILFVHSGALAGQCSGTGIVFAVDTSGSIDDAEFALQTHGTAAALLDPEVLETIERSGGLSVAAVFWADEAAGIRTIGWEKIRGHADATRFAALLTRIHRDIAGATDIGSGLWASLDMFEHPSLCVARRVVDVSGDGRETITPRRRRGSPLRAARARAEAMSVTVNGLAVIDEEKDIEGYYRNHVAIGPGSFVIAAHGFADFQRAMRAKLLREIANPHLASTGQVPPSLPRRQ
jgi:hypothetical protein